MLMPKNMTMVGPGFWDGIDNGDGIPNIWDFPMESLEADHLCEDWDYKFQCLGPVLSEAFSALPQVPLVDVGNGALDMLPNSSVPSVGDSHLIQQPDFVEEISIADFLIDSFDDKESGAFQPPSPISVLESNSSSCSPENSISIGPQLSIPVRTRSKRPQPRPSTSNPWLLMSPIPSTSKKNAYPRKSKEKKKMKLSKLSDVMEMKEKSLQHPVGTKKCTHCEITRTPQWREGPMGPKTLCNACGVRYRSGRLFPEYRPAASPTFVPSLHSNSHKRVIEMRNKCIEETSTCEEDRALSPPPEFVPMSSYLFDLI